MTCKCSKPLTLPHATHRKPEYSEKRDAPCPTKILLVDIGLQKIEVITEEEEVETNNAGLAFKNILQSFEVADSRKRKSRRLSLSQKTGYVVALRLLVLQRVSTN